MFLANAQEEMTLIRGCTVLHAQNDSGKMPQTQKHTCINDKRFCDAASASFSGGGEANPCVILSDPLVIQLLCCVGM